MAWDRALRNTGDRSKGYKVLSVNLPMPLVRAIADKGYNRVKIELRDEGILLIPYVSKDDGRAQGETVELPDAWEQT